MGDRNTLELIAITRRVFAALAGVALAADAVHGNRQRGVGLGRNRSQRHRSGGKALDDLGRTFHLVHGNRLGRIDLELKEAAQGQVAAALVVDDLGIFLIGVEVIGAGAVLQLGDRIGRPHVFLTTRAPGVFATGIQCIGQHRVGAERSAVHADGFFGNLKNADTFDPARGAGEVLVHGLTGQTDRLEQLRTAVAHVGRHAHLGHDF